MNSISNYNVSFCVIRFLSSYKSSGISVKAETFSIFSFSFFSASGAAEHKFYMYRIARPPRKRRDPISAAFEKKKVNKRRLRISTAALI